MSVVHICNYCGDTIDADDLSVTLDVRGEVPDSTRYNGERYVSGWIGHYHTDPNDYGQPSCYDRVRDAMQLAESFGPTLESIPTATAQAITAQRRRHRRPAATRTVAVADAPTTVDWLKLATATIYALHRNDVRTIDDVRAHVAAGTLRTLPYIGARRENEIRDALAAHDADRERVTA